MFTATTPSVKCVYFAPLDPAASAWDESSSCVQKLRCGVVGHRLPESKNDVESVHLVRSRQGRGSDLQKLQSEELPTPPQHASGLPQRHTHVRDVAQAERNCTNVDALSSCRLPHPLHKRQRDRAAVQEHHAVWCRSVHPLLFRRVAPAQGPRRQTQWSPRLPDSHSPQPHCRPRPQPPRTPGRGQLERC